MRHAKEQPEKLWRTIHEFVRSEHHEWENALGQVQRESERYQATAEQYRQELKRSQIEKATLKEALSFVGQGREQISDTSLENRHLSNKQEKSSSPFASLSTPSPAKPMAFKGARFDGDPNDLDRFLRHLERDFTLYSANFPSDKHQVAYAISGLAERAEKWTTQFDYRDEYGVLEDWRSFRAALRDQFEDPDLLHNKRSELLTLRQGDDLMDFVMTFEALATQVNLRQAEWASVFLNGLTERLAAPIRCSEVDLADYAAIKTRAFRLERHGRPQRWRHAEPRKFRHPRLAPPHDLPGSNAAAPVEKRDIVCYSCKQKGHISRRCSHAKITRELRSLENEMTDEEAKNSSP